MNYLRAMLLATGFLAVLHAGPATTNPTPEFVETQSEMRVYIDHYSRVHWKHSSPI